jgi:hypothetical protein
MVMDDGRLEALQMYGERVLLEHDHEDHPVRRSTIAALCLEVLDLRERVAALAAEVEALRGLVTHA